MDKGLRNTLISILGVVLVGFAGAWIQINSRISVVEIQVQNDHDMFIVNQDKASKDMAVLMQKINDIQIKVTQLGDLKADKEFK
jgi:hypothetical protein